MKIFKIPSALILIIFISFFLFSGKTKDPPVVTERNGTAILLTGAAARIPQEASMLEDLYNRGELKDVVFISGVSSGALNAVMLNAILSGKMSWAEYKGILFSLKNSDIFIQNEKKRLPVNTDPARRLYTSIVEGRLGYHAIGDLPVTTSISFTYLRDLDLRKTVYRMCSRNINEESDPTLSLVDIMLASSSFPIAFPPVRIRNVKTIPDVEYVDGGVGEDHIPYHALLEFEKARGKGVSKVYIVSRKSDSIPEVSEELKVLGIDDNGRFDRLGISLDNILKRGMLKRLKAFSEEAPDMVNLSYVCVPDFNKDFLLFDFENLSEQYNLTTQWAKTHKPVPLGEFLLQNGIRTK
jgi:predicted acylesterase/phospholipase RssA